MTTTTSDAERIASVAESIRIARRQWVAYREAREAHELLLAAWKRRRDAGRVAVEDAANLLGPAYEGSTDGLARAQAYALVSIAWSLRNLVDEPEQPTPPYDPSFPDPDGELEVWQLEAFGVFAPDEDGMEAQFRAAMDVANDERTTHA